MTNRSLFQKERSFVLKFLSLAIRQWQPCPIMEADSRHFSVVILDEGQSSATHLEKEIRFRFGINVESAWEGVLAPCLPEQLIYFPTDRRFDSSGKGGVRHKIVLADTGVEKLRVQLDGHTWFRRFVGLGWSIGDFL